MKLIQILTVELIIEKKVNKKLFVFMC